MVFVSGVNLVGFFVCVVVELIRFGFELDDVGRFGIIVLYTKLVDGVFVVMMVLVPPPPPPLLLL